MNDVVRSKPRVLITGGTGFVGAHLIRLLRAYAASIAVLAPAIDGSREREVDYYSADVRDHSRVRSIIEKVCPGHVYHLAGISSVEMSWADAHLTYEVNVLGAFNVFESAMGLSVPATVLNVSSSQIYAAVDETLSEDSMVFPSSPYAASKAMAEVLVTQYKEAACGGILTARPFNHTGPGQKTSFVVSAIAKQFAEMQLRLRPRTLEIGNINVKRDFTDVRDVVQAYALLLESGEINEAYNVCSGVSVNLADIIGMCQEITGIGVTLHRDPTKTRDNEVPEVRGDSTKLRNKTGWYPKISLQQTVSDLIKYWRSMISGQSGESVFY
jgi:GDP-4-dehydro-6-deoxy-D-mannose reductase